jgi:hypothetical protein
MEVLGSWEVGQHKLRAFSCSKGKNNAIRIGGEMATELICIPSKDVEMLIQTFNFFLMSSEELRSTSNRLSQQTYIITRCKT